MIAFWLYLAAVCYNTVNIIRLLHGNFEMGANYNLTPFAKIRGIAASTDRVYVILNIVGNVVMFAPLGFLLPLLWRSWRGISIFLTSALLSCGIELLQLFTGRGADVDDVILNTLGGVCGYLSFLIAKSVFPGTAGRFRVKNCDRRTAAAKQPARPQSELLQQPVPHCRPNQGRRVRRAVLTASLALLCVLVSGTIIRYRPVQTVVDAGDADRLNSCGKKLRVRLKIDTGMHRLGERYDMDESIRHMMQLPNLVVEGLFTHLCVSDSREEDFCPDLRPVLSLKVRVECVHELHKEETAGYGLEFAAPVDMRVASIAAGYADGIPRVLSGRGAVLLHGKCAKLVGRICMDCLLVDVTGIPVVRHGDYCNLNRSGW